MTETARKQKIKLNRADEDVGLYDFNRVGTETEDDICDTDRTFTRGGKDFETKESILPPRLRDPSSGSGGTINLSAIEIKSRSSSQNN